MKTVFVEDSTEDGIDDYTVDPVAPKARPLYRIANIIGNVVLGVIAFMFGLVAIAIVGHLNEETPKPVRVALNTQVKSYVPALPPKEVVAAQNSPLPRVSQITVPNTGDAIISATLLANVVQPKQVKTTLDMRVADENKPATSKAPKPDWSDVFSQMASRPSTIGDNKPSLPTLLSPPVKPQPRPTPEVVVSTAVVNKSVLTGSSTHGAGDIQTFNFHFAETKQESENLNGFDYTGIKIPKRKRNLVEPDGMRKLSEEVLSQYLPMTCMKWRKWVKSLGDENGDRSKEQLAEVPEPIRKVFEDQRSAYYAKVLVKICTKNPKHGDCKGITRGRLIGYANEAADYLGQNALPLKVVLRNMGIRIPRKGTQLR